ncbi:MAG TPA: hypothetical protein HA262_13655 [Methanosarcina sp.]|jgi:hypothetical protein|nr:hypothetical protein [Methanosarcina sp.]
MIVVRLQYLIYRFSFLVTVSSTQLEFFIIFSEYHPGFNRFFKLAELFLLSKKPEIHNSAKSFLNAIKNNEQAFVPYQKSEIAFLRA